MQARILSHGASRSFPAGDAFLDQHVPDGDVLVVVGERADTALAGIDASTWSMACPCAPSPADASSDRTHASSICICGGWGGAWGWAWAMQQDAGT
jgi:hypothetical protein